MIIFNILVIVFICVFIIDYSGVVFDLSKFFWKLGNPEREWKYQIIGKPFGCSLCMSFWITFIYGLFGLSFIYALGIACLAAILSILVNKLIGVLIKIINKIE